MYELSLYHNYLKIIYIAEELTYYIIYGTLLIILITSSKLGIESENIIFTPVLYWDNSVNIITGHNLGA
jgi:hypothetical protein